ncbi:serine hydrolase domain-containing protein [Haloplanus halophilus]|uniref:serine hydrolase domain-containing protein n=1 Tax=Haloplanus halophilus TaxID=2949993 RepID=UPI00203CF642|nr:serine hydrolase domain-containing protein [Haloplanus sp. GDY1]
MDSPFTTDPAARVRQVFESHVAAGLHHGAQLAVYDGADLVLDCAAGTVGPDGPETTTDRRHVLFSCTKPYAGVCLHHLVERGRLDYDDPVRDHWPEFAAAGSEKAAATVRHALSHQAGLPRSPLDDDPTRWTDWDAAVSAMEALDTAFRPGSTAAYHALTYGFLVGELVRRVSGRPVDAYAREHVFEPLGMADTSIGLPADDPDDVATLAGFEAGERCRESAAGLSGTAAEAAALFNRESVRRAVVPAATGVGTARDMARFYACLANGGELDGVCLLDADTVDEATSVQAEVERDGTMGVPRRYALGFERAGTAWDKYGTVAPRATFGHGGLGSIVGWGDPESGLAMAYVTNGIRDEVEHAMRANAMADAVRTAFGSS